MTYRILDRESAVDYLFAIPAVKEILGDGSVRVDEIGDGNLNYVYRVVSELDESKSVILKQAVPYLRLAGEGWPLGRDRMTYEIRALQTYNELVPEFVPTLFHADEEMSTMVMQCLDDHIILRHGMIDGVTYPSVGEHTGSFLAKTLFGTSVYGMESEPRRNLMDRFLLNAELCKLTEDFIFTFPYMTHDSNYSNPATEQWADENLRNNAEYKLDVLEFKNLFMTKADALLHADLHTGSLMVNQSESFVIDMEFAYFGPFGFDVGKIISNFVLAATSHIYRSEDDHYQNWVLDQIPVIWNTFETEFLGLWTNSAGGAMTIDGLLTPAEHEAMRSAFMVDLLVETIGFAACSMARRTLGIAGVADIRDIEDVDLRSKLEIANLTLSMELMARRRDLTTIDQLVDHVKTFYASLNL